MRQLAILMLSLAIALPASATTLLYQDVEALVKGSDLIFTGTVVHTEMRPTAETRFPFTLVTFEIEEILAGATESSTEITLLFAGGRTEDQISHIPGIPRFEEGAKHLLFVRDNGRAACPLVGWQQGKLDFKRHPLSGEELLTDGRGRIVTGIEEDRWRLSEARLTAEGAFAEPSHEGVTLLSTEGVEISEPDGSVATLAAGAVVSATSLLTELESYVSRARTVGTLKSAPLARSASASDVPPTLIPRTDALTDEEGR